MRILHVTSFCVPGMGYEENYLPSAQAAAGNLVRVITSDRIPRILQNISRLSHQFPQGRINQNRAKDGGVTTLRLPSIPEIYGQVVLVGLHRELSRFHPDVVHAHGAFAPPSIQCLMLKRKIGYKLFIDDHSNKSNFHVNTASKEAYLKIVGEIYKRLGPSVTAFLPVVPDSAEILQNRLKIPARVILPVSLGADTEVFKSSPLLRAATRQRLGIRAGQLLVISAGKLQPDKDIDVLIRAFSQLADKDSSLRLLLSGEGDQAYEAYLKSLIGTHGPSGKVLLQGFVPHDDLPSYFNAADIGVWPGAPSIAVLEAVACGLPCVLPSDDSAYAILRSHQACITFARGDQRDLERALSTLLHDETARTTIRENAFRCADGVLSWAAVSEKILRIYVGE